MAFSIRKDAFAKGVISVKIIPYYDYGVCMRKYNDAKYELWNCENIPLSVISKASATFITENDIKEIHYKGHVFSINNTENVRKELFDFLVNLEEKNL